MCTLVALIAPGLDDPVVIAANRDEMLDRPALPFGRHWPERPWRAGKDALAGGTWAGVHDAGFGVFVLNRERSLGPEQGKRSRGLLALDLLEAGSFAGAVQCARDLPPHDYRPFHAILASAQGATGVTGGGGEVARVQEASSDVTLWTSQGPNTDASPRQLVHRVGFEDARRCWSEDRDLDRLFDDLERLLAAPAPPGASPLDAMCIRDPTRGFGTRSSLLVAFGPRSEGGSAIVRIRVADGPPDRTAFRPA